MKEKVIITGESSFLGFHLIEAVLEKNTDVYAGVRKGSDISHLKHLPISFIYLDLSGSNSLLEEMREKRYYIIHAAGITRARTEIQFNVVNADYTFNLALAVQHSAMPIKKFIYISSLAALVYAKDVASVAVTSLFSNYNGSYNLSDGNCYSRYDLTNYLKKYLQTKTVPVGMARAMAIATENMYQILNKIPALNREKINELSAANWVCNIDKAKRELGFNPVYNLEDRLKESLDCTKNTIGYNKHHKYFGYYQNLVEAI